MHGELPEEILIADPSRPNGATKNAARIRVRRLEPVAVPRSITLFLLSRSASNGLACLHHFPRHDQLLNFGRAFVDAKRADFTIEGFDLNADANPVAAKNLHGTIDHSLRHFGRKGLGSRGLARDPRRATILFPGRTINQQCGSIDVDCTVRQRGLSELEVRERSTEHVAGCRCIGHLMESTACQTECSSSYR